jgi:hypothetical protein
MPTSSKTVRVVISSTFRDMQAELDYLVTVVFPELRVRVEQLGSCNFPTWTCRTERASCDPSDMPQWLGSG